MEGAEKRCLSRGRALSPARPDVDSGPADLERLKGQNSKLSTSFPQDSTRSLSQHDLAVASSSMVLDPTRSSPSDQAAQARMHPQSLTPLETAPVTGYNGPPHTDSTLVGVPPVDGIGHAS
ncbi:hypothetical protein DUNSADRAFT_17910 [Dunaliella salina]|uniref:Encoded protein n=1 Tax=Dunaliella salina TaxID=3046 RepID=A0ABQ7H900_DUNSA|nr:hypothetical protein DUNSADRAFT_17910 [Dunaliella salina]|eukprot:KAF5843332.1 hypothetical protein DUNSADRAFT_17910 [Dunaliella salina]